MSSGDCTVTPGYLYTSSPSDRVTKSKQNAQGAPLVRLNAASVGSRELVPADVRQLVPSVNRNILINGNFDLWQRGGYFNADNLPVVLGASANEEFGPDRWSLGTPSGANKRNISRPPMPVGVSNGVPNEPTWYLHWDQLVAESAPKLSQPIEDVRTLAGKNMTVSWWMKGNITANVTCRLKQWWGGSPPPGPRLIAATTGGTAALVNGAPWKQYTATFAIPSLVGETIGGTSSLVLQFLLPGSAIFQIDFSQIQMEEGSTATAFETLSYLEVSRRCERYFEYHGGIAADDITHNHPCYYFATRKYTAPTLTLVAGYAGTGLAFLPLLNVGYQQSVANSVVTAFFIGADAEIYGVSD